MAANQSQLVDTKLIRTFRTNLYHQFTKYDIEFPGIDLKESKRYQEIYHVIFISSVF